MMGVADSFIPSKTYTRFTLTATLERDGKVFEGVTQEYDCAKLNPSLCPESEMNVLGDMEDDSFMTAGLVISILVVVFGLVCIGIFRWKKKRGAFMVF